MQNLETHAILRLLARFDLDADTLTLLETLRECRDFRRNLKAGDAMPLEHLTLATLTCAESVGGVLV